MFTLRDYQQGALTTLQNYFEVCVRLEDANVAFYQSTLANYGTGIPYQPAPGLGGLPYVCIRIPTGGGKTFVACYAVASACKHLLHSDRHLALWLVPSNAIRDQTLKALRDLRHPYRLALEDELGEVTILDLDDALSIPRATLDSSTAIIVSTIQAFRVEELEGRKVYESAGDLMDHFTGISDSESMGLDVSSAGEPLASLSNVLALRRPVIIVDEAHNARTELSFETLSRFNPSCIIEFTATPDTATNPSNVIYSVSASELKAEDMIKMPIFLETRQDWKELLADSIARLDQLSEVAEIEKATTGEYIRPIMLLQAQPRQGSNPVTVDVLEETLVNDFAIPIDHIARATGADRGLEGIEILAEDCPIRYVITVQALREGWDCPFAYILCSVAEMRSGIAVEQILGRVTRLPNVKRKSQEPLNSAYAFSASTNFAETATALVDGLVANGFDQLEASRMIRGIPHDQMKLEDLPLFRSVREGVPIATDESLDVSNLSSGLNSKLEFDAESNHWLLIDELDDDELKSLVAAFDTETSKEAVEAAHRESLELFDEAGEDTLGTGISVPILAVQSAPEQAPIPFDTSHFKVLVDLAQVDSALAPDVFPDEPPPAQHGKIDVENGGPKVQFIQELHGQVRVFAHDQGWEMADLIAWLDKSLSKRSDIRASDSVAFITGVVQNLVEDRGLSLEHLIHDKYRLANSIMGVIDQYRTDLQRETFQPFMDLETTPLTVTPECCFTFRPETYPIARPYKGNFKFKKHFYDLIGDFDTGEEEECAVFIDNVPEIRTWIRNPARGSNSFWLQTMTDRFYPDFVCLLEDEVFGCGIQGRRPLEQRGFHRKTPNWKGVGESKQRSRSVHNAKG